MWTTKRELKKQIGELSKKVTGLENAIFNRNDYYIPTERKNITEKLKSNIIDMVNESIEGTKTYAELVTLHKAILNLTLEFKK